MAESDLSNPEQIAPSYEDLYPHLLRLKDKLTSQKPDYLKPLISKALHTPRHPIANQSLPIPISESYREQFSEINGGWQEAISRAKKNGFFIKTDSVKTQDISNLFGHDKGDAYIAANYEILLTAAEKLNADIVLGVYSGDENTGVLIPKDSNIPISEDLVQQTVLQITREYFTNPKTEAFFADIRHYLQHNEPKQLQTITIDLVLCSQAQTTEKIAINAKNESRVVNKTGPELMAGIIDAAENGESLKNNKSILLIDALSKNLNEKRPSHFASRYNNSLEELMSDENIPPKLRKIIDSCQANLPNDLSLKNEAIEQIFTYTELALYEPLFPDSLEIRRIEWLNSDIESGLNTGKRCFLARAADIRLKAINKESHLMGDYHMIATMRIIQQALMAEGIDPHQGISYYQHFGSFMLKIDCEQEDTSRCHGIQKILENPEIMNAKAYARELHYLRLDKETRATPLIATTMTLKDSTGKPSFIEVTKQTIQSQEQMGQIIDQMRLEQNAREAVFAFNMANFATTLLTTLSEYTPNLDPRIDNQGKDMQRIAYYRQLSTVLDLFHNAPGEYFSYRPHRQRYLIDHLHDR